ncbi:protein lev-9-like [Dreissena polymorpha]|uniref:protein lev-9-like n=1 Tax=Dreissena polymorpha TaxID=45954 RepID=UPI00226462DF|nr:protein lev-9-like [Dreissena polymorpha]
MWENANCTIKDCGTLPNPEHGSIEILSDTKYLAEVAYTCKHGYELIGDQSRTCQSTGTWSGETPYCRQTGVPKIVCPTNTDYRGREWREVLSGTLRTQLCDDNERFKGNASRFCAADGSWQHPQYNCVRDSVDHVLNQVCDFTLTYVRIDTIYNNTFYNILNRRMPLISLMQLRVLLH